MRETLALSAEHAAKKVWWCVLPKRAVRGRGADRQAGFAQPAPMRAARYLSLLPAHKDSPRRLRRARRGLKIRRVTAMANCRRWTCRLSSPPPPPHSSSLTNQSHEKCIIPATSFRARAVAMCSELVVALLRHAIQTLRERGNGMTKC